VPILERVSYIKFDIEIFFCISILWFTHNLSTKEKVELQIPWFIKEKLNDFGEYKYNYRDSLFKYQVLEIDRIENQSNYYSYLSNLRFRVNGNKEITFQYLQRAIKLDTTAFCNELIRETYQ